MTSNMLLKTFHRLWEIKQIEKEIFDFVRKYDINLQNLCTEQKFVPNCLQYRLFFITSPSQQCLNWVSQEDFSLFEYPRLTLTSSFFLYIPFLLANVLTIFVYHTLLLCALMLWALTLVAAVLFIPTRILYTSHYNKEAAKLLRLVRGKAIEIEDMNLVQNSMRKLGFLSTLSTILNWISVSCCLPSDNVQPVETTEEHWKRLLQSAPTNLRSYIFLFFLYIKSIYYRLFFNLPNTYFCLNDIDCYFSTNIIWLFFCVFSVLANQAVPASVRQEYNSSLRP